MAIIEFYVMLTFDNMKLLVKQKEIRVVEVIEDVETSVKTEESLAGIMGWISHGEQQFPVFSLSDELEILDYLPAKRALCVLLEAGVDAIFGVTCEEVVSLDHLPHLLVYPMPDAMFSVHSPLHHLAIYQEKEIACITDSESLLGYLSAYAEAHMAEIEEHEDRFEHQDDDIEPVIVTDNEDKADIDASALIV